MVIENKSYPLVSVIIPNFNNSNSIVEAVHSVLRGTYKNVEILIYDDASTDESVVQLKALELNHPEVTVTYSDINKGAGYARNALLEKAKGDILAFLDADDIWKANKLERQVQLLLDLNLDIVTCAYDIVDQNSGNRIGHRTPIKNLTYFKMLLTNWLPMSMTIVRSNLDNAKTMPTIRSRQDYAYWLNIFRSNNNISYGVVNETLGTYNRSGASLSSSKIKNLKNNYLMFRHNFGYIGSIFFTICNILVRVLRS